MNKAFTLIEILTVIVIMSLSLSVGYISYNRSQQEKNLVKDAQGVGNLLALAKERTISRDISPDASCVNFRGYAVNFQTTTNPDTYNLNFICRGTSSDVVTAISENYPLRNTNMISTIGGNRVPFFYPYGCLDPTYDSVHNVSNSVCSNTATRRTVILQSKYLTTRCVTITVNNIGVITVGDPSEC